MKTDDLIAMLANDPGPVPRHGIERRFAVAVLAGLGGGLVLMLLLFGMRPGVVQDMALPMFWGKLVFAGLLAAGGLAVLRRLARPGMGLGHSLALLALPPLVLWGLAAVALGQ
ncbi:MAG TPA: NrsF family protein, partial [Giesbergeria sp.]|nr:NrsF family protein [Giesbergeria sp.]